ncbi:MAG TPA: class I SAM-dependent methyltransferase [Polyangiaceae bacterium]|jgi:cyclopropane-fatty-acyl-phospholipid synthase
MGSTQAEVEVSYDVSNEFFRLWLDERMNYTCGIFEEPNEGWKTDSLEEAQVRKLDWHHKMAKLSPEKRLLDIGCGWGANLEYQAVNKGVKECHGITLSRSQHEEITRRNIPGVTASVCSYADYKPAKKFDAVISICMMEHIASPEQARAGKHLDLYREYFRLAHEWTNPGSHFSLQVIIRNRFPRTRQEIQDIGFCTYKIFPGGLSLRLEDVIQSVTPHWEVMEMRVRRIDYQKTCQAWLDRLRDHQALIEKKWGPQTFADYDRYLSTCVNAFDKHYQSLAQYQLRRID